MANILVVDDEEQVREVVSELLALDGHNVISAVDGLDALDKLSTDIELIIVDLIMPRKTGSDLIKEVRVLYPNMLIVVISGGGNLKGTVGDGVHSESLLGVEFFIQKPFHGEEIRSVVEKILSSSR